MIEFSPIETARRAAVQMAEDASAVGRFLSRSDLGDGVYDFRFQSLLRGYEQWQWSVSLYHDVQMEEWTVNESSLLPNPDALLAPAWVPWRERLRPSDLSVTDVLGTAPDDSRLEDGFLPTDERAAKDADIGQTVREIVEEYRLSRSHVLTSSARQKIAQRWYNGPHGPKSLSTRAAAGYVCETCAFFIPLRGDLGEVFGVCANKWSPDDGRVVSLDHGCGEHSEIAPQQTTGLWPDNKPTYDDGHIDILARTEREDPDHSRVVENLDEVIEEAEETVSAKVDRTEEDGFRDAQPGDIAQ